KAQCCGAGGGVRTGTPDEAEEIGKRRAEMIKNTGADTVVTVCPFCEYHIHQTTGLPVINIVSLMADGYRRKDELKKRG
ncbi:MAG TPA: heterodisulfide reductase-related iron-sulfur binding cluster, partial [Methanocorpusculum sp.]|nr:heterodisulfide reductase-related iron-sulfur binding cluster [Methanocorpusculum sp.]